MSLTSFVGRVRDRVRKDPSPTPTPTSRADPVPFRRGQGAWRRMPALPTSSGVSAGPSPHLRFGAGLRSRNHPLTLQRLEHAAGPSMRLRPIAVLPPAGRGAAGKRYALPALRARSGSPDLGAASPGRPDTSWSDTGTTSVAHETAVPTLPPIAARATGPSAGGASRRVLAVAAAAVTAITGRSTATLSSAAVIPRPAPVPGSTPARRSTEPAQTPPSSATSPPSPAPASGSTVTRRSTGPRPTSPGPPTSSAPAGDAAPVAAPATLPSSAIHLHRASRPLASAPGRRLSVGDLHRSVSAAASTTATSPTTATSAVTPVARRLRVDLPDVGLAARASSPTTEPQAHASAVGVARAAVGAPAAPAVERSIEPSRSPVAVAAASAVRALRRLRAGDAAARTIDLPGPAPAAITTAAAGPVSRSTDRAVVTPAEVVADTPQIHAPVRRAIVWATAPGDPPDSDLRPAQPNPAVRRIVDRSVSSAGGLPLADAAGAEGAPGHIETVTTSAARRIDDGANAPSEPTRSGDGRAHLPAADVGASRRAPPAIRRRAGSTDGPAAASAPLAESSLSRMLQPTTDSTDSTSSAVALSALDDVRTSTSAPPLRHLARTSVSASSSATVTAPERHPAEQLGLPPINPVNRTRAVRREVAASRAPVHRATPVGTSVAQLEAVLIGREVIGRPERSPTNTPVAAVPAADPDDSVARRLDGPPGFDDGPAVDGVGVVTAEPAAAPSSSGSVSIDEVAAQVYRRVTTELRRELHGQRERKGSMIDGW